jgi:hypothetical protein
MQTLQDLEGALTSSSAELLVNPFQQRGKDKAQETSGEGSSMNMLEFCMRLARGGLCGRMSPMFYASTVGGISFNSSRRFLNAGMGSLGECWTLDFSECPNPAAESSLSGILETGEHLQKYCLSKKALAGMIGRAKRNNIKIPQWMFISTAGIKASGFTRPI